jgi:hypothetical protein
MNTLLAIVSLVGGLVALVAGLLAIRRHYNPEAKAQIVNPSHQSDNDGRHLTVSVTIPNQRRGIAYWIAVQPDDCRADGLWWPQNRPLTVQQGDFASLGRVRLGRETSTDMPDVGKTFTIGLFEVTKGAQSTFSEFADRDDPMILPAQSKILHSVDVRRVRH